MPTTRYMSVLVDTGPLSVGLDSSERAMYSVNLILQAIPPVDNMELDIKQLLDDAGLLPVEEVRIGPKSIVPVGAGPFMQIIDTGGFQNQLVHGKGPDNVAWENLSCQVFLHGDDDGSVKVLAIDVARSLHGQHFNVDVTVP